MPLVHDFITPPNDVDGTVPGAKKVANVKVDTGSGDEFRGVVCIGSPDHDTGKDRVAEVKGTIPAKTDQGVVTREAPLDLLVADFSFVTSGDHDVITPGADQLFEIYQLWLWANDDNDVAFKHGATTYAGAQKVAQGGEILRPVTKCPWFVGAADEVFKINLSQDHSVVGMVYYRLL